MQGRLVALLKRTRADIRRGQPFACLWLALFAFGLHDCARAQEELAYQKRGNRYEGIRAKPVSGFDIELLSVRADYKEAEQKLGERFFAQFYLERTSRVFLTVREIDYRYYYWLDNVEPRSPWRAGFGNVFDWPTRDVIRQLSDLRISDLGVVARLNTQQPGEEESVAPVVLYQSRPPVEISAYLFTFKLRDDAKVTSAIYQEGKKEPLTKQTFPRQTGGRPFTIRWDASSSGASAGDYKLVLTGYFLDTNDPVHQTVRFHHQPRVE